MDCPVCNQPEGECYNICPRSQRYYSPAQEREDDAFNSGATLADHHAAWHAQNGANAVCPWDCGAGEPHGVCEGCGAAGDQECDAAYHAELDALLARHAD